MEMIRKVIEPDYPCLRAFANGNVVTALETACPQAVGLRAQTACGQAVSIQKSIACAGEGAVIRRTYVAHEHRQN